MPVSVEERLGRERKRNGGWAAICPSLTFRRSFTHARYKCTCCTWGARIPSWRVGLKSHTLYTRPSVCATHAETPHLLAMRYLTSTSEIIHHTHTYWNWRTNLPHSCSVVAPGRSRLTLVMSSECYYSSCLATRNVGQLDCRQCHAAFHQLNWRQLAV